jgi:hypothetical protein
VIGTIEACDLAQPNALGFQSLFDLLIVFNLYEIGCHHLPPAKVVCKAQKCDVANPTEEPSTVEPGDGYNKTKIMIQGRRKAGDSPCEARTDCSIIPQF